MSPISENACINKTKVVLKKEEHKPLQKFSTSYSYYQTTVSKDTGNANFNTHKQVTAYLKICSDLSANIQKH